MIKFDQIRSKNLCSGNHSLLKLNPLFQKKIFLYEEIAEKETFDELDCAAKGSEQVTKFYIYNEIVLLNICR